MKFALSQCLKTRAGWVIVFACLSIALTTNSEAEPAPEFLRHQYQGLAIDGVDNCRSLESGEAINPDTDSQGFPNAELGDAGVQLNQFGIRGYYFACTFVDFWNRNLPSKNPWVEHGALPQKFTIAVALCGGQEGGDVDGPDLEFMTIIPINDNSIRVKIFGESFKGLSFQNMSLTDCSQDQ